MLRKQLIQLTAIAVVVFSFYQSMSIRIGIAEDTSSHETTITSGDFRPVSKDSARDNVSIIPSIVPGSSSSKARARWLISSIDSLPSLDWQSIATNGKASSTIPSKEGVVVLWSSIPNNSAPNSSPCLVAINSLPWPEQVELQWNMPVPKGSELLTLTHLKTNELHNNALAIHRVDTERFRVNQVRQESVTPANSPSIQAETEGTKAHLLASDTNDGWRFQLPAMSMAVWTWKHEQSPLATSHIIGSPLRQWSKLSSQEGVDLMAENVATISEVIQRMTNFRSDFGNQMDGSFEVTNIEQLKSLPSSSSTWLLSLNPTATWSNSSHQFHSPGKSLQYESSNTQANAWIQTKAFPRRVKWPLAVEVWLRVQEQSQRPSIKLITTGTLGETKLTESKQINPSDFAEDTPDAWRRYEFPTLHKVKSGEALAVLASNEMLQWTIEISGPGRLWIDDMGMSPLVLTEEERRLIRSQLFVAKRELEQRQPSKALDWIESPLVLRILQLSYECPPDFLRPIVRATKPIATTKRPSFLQSTNGWFWRPLQTDLEPETGRLSKGIQSIPAPTIKR